MKKFKSIITSFFNLLSPYTKVLKFILIIFVIMIILVEAANLINKPNTISVLIGIGLNGIVFVFIYETLLKISKKIFNGESKENENDEN